MRQRLWWVAFCFAPLAAGAVPSIVEPVTTGVWVVRDDNGIWGGMTNGITHQNTSPYEAKKILDTSAVPAEVWGQLREVRLSLYFMVRDYSWHGQPEANGLNESYEVVVNGTVHRFPTNGGAPVYAERGAPTIAWHDVILPKEELKQGVNEIVVRKTADSKGDDYLYLGIDNSVRRGNSTVNFDGKAWTTEKLTIPGGNGEYMIRAYLIARPTEVKLTWRPGAAKPLEDETELVLFAGTRKARLDATGLHLAAGQSARLEWRPGSLDTLREATATVELSGPAEAAWLNADGAPINPPVKGDQSLKLALPAGGPRTSGLVVTARQPLQIRNVSLAAGRSFQPAPKPIQLAPAMTPAAPVPDRAPSARIEGATATLQNSGLRARFELGERLRLASLYNEHTRTEMLRAPDQAMLFMIDAAGQRYGGSRDFRCAGLKPIKNGFTARLERTEPAIAADLTASIDAEGLHLALNVLNSGATPLDFTVAFPHLAGLAASEQAATDYYYFPSGGGIIGDRPAIIRRGYGDHEALYQVMDIYSPAKGGGLMMRADDAEGWHKVLAFRKHVPGATEQSEQQMWIMQRVKEEYRPRSSVEEPVPGSSMAYEYLRRTRAPGGSFAPAPAVIAAHSGDWHTALQSYSDWAHRVWKWRPTPSKLRSIRNMMAAGWGKGILFKDGQYRTDIIRPDTDCIELMSWWDWSETGPFNTPFDRLDEVLTPAQIKMWEGYFVTDPVTGKKMWNNQPGDYKGYNERFGGLPAFRKAIETYRDMGALVTLYTDPFRLDESSETGRLYGKQWSVVGVDGKKSTGYEVWNPCHDLPEVREWVAQTMGRVMRETGADGIRLDEYGHRGWACYDPTHEHTYAEPGITQWQKATTEATRMVHAEMDKVRPDLVLTTEHPGYDYMMTSLEGCITYDLTVMKSALRPLECNIQRFYFPECKAYELDHQGADPQDRKKFWNAVESFGRYYPKPYYNILSDNEDAYQDGASYPLLVTPGAADQVYVNRFGSGAKTLYHLYNATGYTFDGVALTVDLKPGEHLVDLLNAEELATTRRADGRGHDVRLFIDRADVACVAQLPKRLTLSRNGAALTAEAQLPAGAHKLVVTDLKGELLAEQAVSGPRTTIDLAALPAGSAPALVKLLRDGIMIDAAPVPAP